MDRIINLKPFKDFFKSQTTGGILLIFCVMISLLIANSSWSNGFERFLSTEFGFTNRFIDLNYSFLNWINDGLMAIFS